MLATLYIGVYVSHLALSLQTVFKNRIGTHERRDPLYSAAALYLTYGLIYLVQALALAQRLRDPGSPTFAWIGSWVYLLGIALRVWAIRALGQFFTLEIGIRPGQAVVEKGPYRWMRHPSYSGYLLMLIGMLVAYESAWNILPLVGTAIFMVLRIRQEERMLAEHFKDAYRDYQRRSSRLVPFLY